MSQTDFQKNSKIFNLLFEGISEGIIVVDDSQHVVEVNSATEVMFGYNKGELINKHLDVLIPKDYRSNHHKHVDKFIDNSEKRQMGHGRNIYGLKKNGEIFPVEAGLNPFQFEGERYVMSLISDITQRKTQQQEIEELNRDLEQKIDKRTEELKLTIQELQHSNSKLESEVYKRKQAESKTKKALQKEIELNELKTKFLSLVSHEFKTPLSGILTSSTLASKYTQTEQQDKRERHLSTIKNKVHYLTGILYDFLSIERLESGKVTYKFEEFSLITLVNEVIYNANVTLKDGQEILYPQNLQDISLRQDKHVLELVLSNLLNNAIKYSPEDTSIYFEVDTTEANLIKFRIKDEGIGIPQQDQKHIFERYFRAENALNNQGTGIGLNIAKVHLENLKGSICFESIEGKGTTFYIEIPKVHE
ncbi:PAS domain-containing sensor histidine kinase [Psychroflexus sediminis]|uniref:histidine kinase n=1 Tax=Psychroflexus sediminis TaxID=470826 RepID=A0A1G7VVH8_9FLAO|nr:PAS domain-containing sensor histidine kinase [Psychroflexus sediminis]SDG63782.1 PAS/PAC sensor signal transduction histidine kinase [Psychroflexus sediminis]